MTSKLYFSWKDILYVGGILLSIGITWGVLSQKAEAGVEAKKELAPVSIAIAELKGLVQGIDESQSETQKDIRELRRSVDSINSRLKSP